MQADIAEKSNEVWSLRQSLVVEEGHHGEARARERDADAEHQAKKCVAERPTSNLRFSG